SRGVGHALRLARALSRGAGTLDSDRSDYDETEVARRVLDHLRFLDANAAPLAGDAELDKLREKAEIYGRRAPFDEPAPQATTPREQALRKYMASFGISSPARVQENAGHAASRLIDALERGLLERPRPSLVYVWARPPDAPNAALASSVRRLLRRGVAIRW